MFSVNANYGKMRRNMDANSNASFISKQLCLSVSIQDLNSVVLTLDMHMVIPPGFVNYARKVIDFICKHYEIQCIAHQYAWVLVCILYTCN